ncbi:MAG: beta-ketoacyl-[acyl-carrier-protein] synthase family protein [Firmicutes bacterium]|nr:beta-ketoacyl-[acyl-carrier-protein] synthase family protein [Bacillota bacterium]
MPQRLLHRVVITGLGALTPYGAGIERLWQGLCYGAPAIGPITRFDASDLAVRIAAEVPAFDPLDFMEKKQARRSARFSQYALAASRMALDDAEYRATPQEAAGVFMGTSGGGYDVADFVREAERRGWRHVDPLFVQKIGGHMAAVRPGLDLGLRGPSTTTNAACATGLDTIGHAFNTLRLGQAEALLAGGADATLVKIAVAALGRIGALTASHNDDPQRASRPFDAMRDGFVLGEGAGVLFLETLEHALARNARIYAEVLGFGESFDATDETAPDVDGQQRAMHAALRDAGISADEIDAVKAHGTSTVLNDATETAALKAVFGDRAFRIPVTAPKSKLGHAAAASGGIEAVAAVLMLHHQMLPPTVNLEHPDPACDLDYVANGPRPAVLHTLLLDAFGMGGQNSCLVIRRFEE